MNSSIIWGIGGFLAGVILGTSIVPAVMPYGYGMMGNRGGEPGVGMGGNIDARFIEEMIPHHEGAIGMAQIALQRSDRPEIKSLAEGIIDAQTHEIEDMKAWYQEWFGNAPADGRLGRGHGMMAMHGMEGDPQILQTIEREQFDLEFIRQMVVHHEMAIMMASMLEASTARPEMKELADNIITSQSREIRMMQTWYTAWAGIN